MKLIIEKRGNLFVVSDEARPEHRAPGPTEGAAFRAFFNQYPAKFSGYSLEYGVTPIEKGAKRDGICWTASIVFAKKKLCTGSGPCLDEISSGLFRSLAEPIEGVRGRLFELVDRTKDGALA